MAVSFTRAKFWAIRKNVFIALLNQGYLGDFLGGPVVRILPSNAGGGCLIPGRGAKIPYAATKSSPAAVKTAVPVCCN